MHRWASHGGRTDDAPEAVRFLASPDYSGMTLRFRRWLAAVAVVGMTTLESVSLSPLPAASAQPQLSSISLTPCHIDLLAEQVLCGVHEVFVDRERNSGARVPIHVAVLPALRRRVDSDPLFLLAGGPGQGAHGVRR